MYMKHQTATSVLKYSNLRRVKHEGNSGPYALMSTERHDRMVGLLRRDNMKCILKLRKWLGEWKANI